MPLLCPRLRAPYIHLNAQGSARRTWPRTSGECHWFFALCGSRSFSPERSLCARPSKPSMAARTKISVQAAPPIFVQKAASKAEREPLLLDEDFSYFSSLAPNRAFPASPHAACPAFLRCAAFRCVWGWPWSCPRLGTGRGCARRVQPQEPWQNGTGTSSRVFDPACTPMSLGLRPYAPTAAVVYAGSYKS